MDSIYRIGLVIASDLKPVHSLLMCLMLFPQTIKCLVQNNYSINICWTSKLMNENMKK